MNPIPPAIRRRTGARALQLDQRLRRAALRSSTVSMGSCIPCIRPGGSKGFGTNLGAAAGRTRARLRAAERRVPGFRNRKGFYGPAAWIGP